MTCNGCGNKHAARVNTHYDRDPATGTYTKGVDTCDQCGFSPPSIKGLGKTFQKAQDKLGSRYKLVPPDPNTGAVGGVLDMLPHKP